MNRIIPAFVAIFACSYATGTALEQTVGPAGNDGWATRATDAATPLGGKVIIPAVYDSHTSLQHAVSTHLAKVVNRNVW